jgi:hypothetical protein
VILSGEQPSKADAPIFLGREPGSNATSVSEKQAAKQRLPIVSTEAGMQTDVSVGILENASSSMEASADPDSNLTTESFRQPKQHRQQIRWN